MAKLALAGIAAALVYFLLPLRPHSAAVEGVRAETVTGTWIGEFRTHEWGDVSEALWLSIKVQTPSDRYGFSFTVPLKDLQGMTIAPGHRGASQVAFALPRQAGRFDFEGRFREDTGSGDFRFETNPDFA